MGELNTGMYTPGDQITIPPIPEDLILPEDVITRDQAEEFVKKCIVGGYLSGPHNCIGQPYLEACYVLSRQQVAPGKFGVSSFHGLSRTRLREAVESFLKQFPQLEIRIGGESD